MLAAVLLATIALPVTLTGASVALPRIGADLDADLAAVSEHLDPSVRDVLSVRSALAARITPGSTGPGPVADQLAAAADKLTGWREWAAERVVPR